VASKAPTRSRADPPGAAWGLASTAAGEKHIIASRIPGFRLRGFALCGLGLAILDLDDVGVGRIRSCGRCLDYAWAAMLAAKEGVGVDAL
jgi:hypothetical protein